MTAIIKREVFYAIQHGARIDDRTGRLVSGKNVTENVTVNADVLSLKLGVSSRTIKRDLKTLTDKGYIKRVGSDKNGYWKVLIKK